MLTTERIAAAAAAIAVAVAFVVALLTVGSRSPGPSPPEVTPPAPAPAVRAAAVTESPAGGAADRQGPRASAAWVAATARATGMDPLAVGAYAAAALRVADVQPRCRLGWTTLAAIGDIESGHGTHGGATLTADGTTSRRILGPALDGGEGLAAIRSTRASIAWHGDDRWDHAIGPMQFIPTTWERWAADGDGDGRENPHDLDDAALAAARYLCADGRDLQTGEGWSAAVFSYNHSADYVRAALSRANAYSARAN